MPYRRSNSLARTLRVYLHLIFRYLRIPSSHVLDLLAIVVGVLTAIAASFMVQAVIFLIGASWKLVDLLPHPYLMVLIPMLGGLVAGLLSKALSKGREVRGVPDVIQAVLMRSGVIQARRALARLFMTLSSIGSLGSAGLEGPVVQVGAFVGSWVGQILKLGANHVKTLVGCGAAAGIAATFNAPIGGILFSLEVILGTFSPNIFSPIIISAVVAAVTFQTINGPHNTYLLEITYQEKVWEVFFFAGLGLVCGILGLGFTLIMNFTEEFFDRLTIPKLLKPVLGGLMTGLMVYLYHDLAGGSFQIIEKLIHGGGFTLWFLLLIGAMKVLATSFTISSGGCGGVYTPSLVLGGIAGAMVHAILSIWYPEISGVGIYVMVGMAAFVSATTHAPIAGIMLLCEMTGSYTVILPLLAGCVIATIVARSFNEHSIYTIGLAKVGIFLKDGHDLDVLKTYHVYDLMEEDILSVPFDMPIREVLPLLHDSPHEHVLVRNEEKKIEGVISYYDLTPFILEYENGLEKIARDAMHETRHFVYADDPVLSAYDKFLMKETNYLLVLRRDGSYQGVVFKTDIMRRYRKALHQKSLAMSHG